MLCLIYSNIILLVVYVCLCTLYIFIYFNPSFSVFMACLSFIYKKKSLKEKITIKSTSHNKSQKVLCETNTRTHSTHIEPIFLSSCTVFILLSWFVYYTICQIESNQFSPKHKTLRIIQKKTYEEKEAMYP